MKNLYERPQWVRHFNQFGPACGSARALVPLHAEELVETAGAATGLDDFGSEEWRDDLEALVWSLNHEAKLNTLGRLMTRAELLRTLGVRLRLQALWREHPEILEAKVRAPIFISGAARTGTSILQESLSQDTRFHLPYAWRCLDPLPSTDDAIDDRRRRATCETEFWVDVQPEIRAQHDFGSDLPTECLIFMSIDYRGDYWGMVAHMPTWETRRLEKEYFKEAYAWHERILKTMQFGEPEDRVWLLKSPAHLAFLDVLKATYPDVRIIHTHRDPVKCIPSTASITSTVRWERSDEVDCEGIGNNIRFGFQFAMENVLDQRLDGRLPESQIVDVHLQDLIRDPKSVVRQVYEGLGLELPPDLPESVVRYLREKPKGKFGQHSYDMAQFGMDAAGLREQFARYTEHYGVATEA